jgi:hypothetical protein
MDQSRPTIPPLATAACIRACLRSLGIPAEPAPATPAPRPKPGGAASATAAGTTPEPPALPLTCAFGKASTWHD